MCTFSYHIIQQNNEKANTSHGRYNRPQHKIRRPIGKLNLMLSLRKLKRHAKGLRPLKLHAFSVHPCPPACAVRNGQEKYPVPGQGNIPPYLICGERDIFKDLPPPLSGVGKLLLHRLADNGKGFITIASLLRENQFYFCDRLFKIPQVYQKIIYTCIKIIFIIFYLKFIVVF